MKWEVGDKIVDVSCPEYGVGTIKEIVGEGNNWAQLWIHFPKMKGRFGRNSNDPDLRKPTKLDKALE